MSHPSSQVLANPGFRRFALAAFVSLLGDQLTLLALPWLALSIAPQARVVATVLALVALPRALFILVGGALSDRLDVRRMLVGVRVLSALALAGLCAALVRGAVGATELEAFALLFGTLGALGMPAASSILPRMVPSEQVQLGNTILMSLAQLVALVGPMLAGVLLALVHGGAGSAEHDAGFVWAFGLDAGSFLLSAAILAGLTLPPRAAHAGESVLAGMRGGWAHVRSDRGLGAALLYIGIVNFFIVGPISVGIPLLVAQVLGGTALRYGGFLTLMGVGGLFGMAATARSPLRGSPHLLRAMAIVDILSGALLVLFVHLQSAWAMNTVLFVVGAMGGFVQASLLPAIQRRTPEAYMGRVMSFMLFAFIGLVPASAALAGAVAQSFDVHLMLQATGICEAAVALAFMATGRASADLSAPAVADAAPAAAGDAAFQASLADAPRS